MVAELTPRSQEDAAAFRRRIQAQNAANVLWSKPGIRKEYSERMKQFWQDPEKDFPGKVRVLNQDPELRAKRCVTTTELWRNDSGFREKMLKARNDPKYKADQSEWQGGIRLAAFGLLLRGGTNEEIAQITGRESKYIKNLRFRLRERGELPRPTQEEIWLARSKANKGKPRGRSRKSFPLERQYLMRVAGALNDRGFYQEELQYKDALVRIYNESARDLPEEFEVQLILEAFLGAIINFNKDVNTRDFVRRLDRLISHKRFEALKKELLFVGEKHKTVRTIREGEEIIPVMFIMYLLQDEKGNIILPFRNSYYQHERTDENTATQYSLNRTTQPTTKHTTEQPTIESPRAEFLYCCSNCRSFIPVIHPNTHGRDVVTEVIKRIYPTKDDGSCSHPAEIRLKLKRPVTKDKYREGYHLGYK